jgi:hypothetical protein
MPAAFPEDCTGLSRCAGIHPEAIHIRRERRVAGGSYIWKDLASAKAFYNGPWLEGIRRRYDCEPRVSYFETFAIADQGTRLAGAPME